MYIFLVLYRMVHLSLLINIEAKLVKTAKYYQIKDESKPTQTKNRQNVKRPQLGKQICIWSTFNKNMRRKKTIYLSQIVCHDNT